MLWVRQYKDQHHKIYVWNCNYTSKHIKPFDIMRWHRVVDSYAEKVLRLKDVEYDMYYMLESWYLGLKYYSDEYLISSLKKLGFQL